MKKNEILVKNFQKNLKNSNFSQNFLNPCKKFKKNLKKFKRNSKKSKKLQKNLKKFSKIQKIQIFRNKNSQIQKFSKFF